MQASGFQETPRKLQTRAIAQDAPGDCLGFSRGPGTYSTATAAGSSYSLNLRHRSHRLDSSLIAVGINKRVKRLTRELRIYFQGIAYQIHYWP